MKEDMPKLFDVEVEDSDEIKASKFISKLQKKGFVGKNKVYLKNYINADIGIAFSHIKTNYKKYVCEGGWPEEKFEDLIYVIAKNRRMLIPNVFLQYGTLYDDGKLVREIAIERKKYEKSKEVTNEEEQALLDYIKEHGGGKFDES